MEGVGVGAPSRRWKTRERLSCPRRPRPVHEASPGEVAAAAACAPPPLQPPPKSRGDREATGGRLSLGWRVSGRKASAKPSPASLVCAVPRGSMNPKEKYCMVSLLCGLNNQQNRLGCREWTDGRTDGVRGGCGGPGEGGDGIKERASGSTVVTRGQGWGWVGRRRDWAVHTQ